MIVTLTCQTEGCVGKGVGIQVEDPAEFCVCGGCGQEILDKKQ